MISETGSKPIFSISLSVDNTIFPFSCFTIERSEPDQTSPEPI